MAFCRRLNLSHNFFGDGASEEIAEGLSQTGGLCHIDLSSNFLGMKTCIALGRALMASSDTSKHTLQNVGCACSSPDPYLLAWCMCCEMPLFHA